MTIKQLHHKLQTSYTAENLHRITTKIINLYKNQQYGSIIRIMRVVAEFTHENEEQYTRAFYKLMMLYHPDRITHYHGEIDRHLAANNTEQLQRYSHIFAVMELEQTLTLHEPPPRVSPSSDEEEPEQWEYQSTGYRYSTIDDEENAEAEEELLDDDFEPALQETTFYAVFKRIIYGNEAVNIPPHYFQDIDTLELSGYEITDLDGIQYCEQLLRLDISNNKIIDISELSHLTLLNELYLADNQVSFIDALGYMTHLRIVDLSKNDIDDISPLFGLEQLEFLNVVGNAIPDEQIGILEKKGIMIIR